MKALTIIQEDHPGLLAEVTTLLEGFVVSGGNANTGFARGGGMYIEYMSIVFNRK